jgi:hypothetical protein
MQMFADDERTASDGLQDWKSGSEKATVHAESLVLSGAREVRLWKLAGEVKARTITEWDISKQGDER